jgi:hypothetical protein
VLTALEHDGVDELEVNTSGNHVIVMFAEMRKVCERFGAGAA